MKKGLYNPLTRDVKHLLRDDNNKQYEVVLKANEITYLPESEALRMEKHLATAIINERGVKTNHEDEFRDVLEEIRINL